MKKIMFDDKYGLTKAVLEGRKTMTRRLPNKAWRDIMPGLAGEDLSHASTPFKVGEVVAVAQSYNDSGWNPDTLQQTFIKEPTVFPDLDPISPLSGWIDLPLKYHKGWSNKMFVNAGLMPHQIRITGVRVERLKDISDEDCLREGILAGDIEPKMYGFQNGKHKKSYFTPKDAFAALINKISGKGTWKSNPWVYVYEFELVK